MSGRNTELGASAIYDLNAIGYPEYQRGLGTELAEPKNLKQKNIDQLETDENFFGYFDWSLKGGGAAADTDTGVNVLKTITGNSFEVTNISTQTIFQGLQTANGWDFSGDATNDEGFEINQGIAAYYAKHVFTAGTDRFYFETKVKISAVAETDTFLVGFRKAEAHRPDYNDYDEMCAVNVDAGDVVITTILNNGTTATADTALNVGDTEYITTRVEYDVAVGLSSAIALSNSLKAVYTRHIANTAQHTTAADATNVITAANATDLTTLIALVTDQLTQYDVHEDDSELGAAWAYHDAQETGDATPVTAAAPTTLTECITYLNDLKTKFKVHDDDATSHGVATQFPVSVAYASAATFYFGINTTTMTKYNNAVAGFAFDAAEVVLPFISYLRAAGNPLTMELMSYKVGPLA